MQHQKDQNVKTQHNICWLTITAHRKTARYDTKNMIKAAHDKLYYINAFTVTVIR